MINEDMQLVPWLLLQFTHQCTQRKNFQILFKFLIVTEYLVENMSIFLVWDVMDVLYLYLAFETFSNSA